MSRAEQIVEVPMGTEEAMAQALAALAAMPKVKGPPVMVSPTMAQARTRMNLKTFGDTVTVEVRPGDGATRIRVTSECFQLLDWGRHADNVGAVVAGLGPSRPAW